MRGSKGDPGLQGPVGMVGDPGPKGNQGPQGLQGPEASFDTQPPHCQPNTVLYNWLGHNINVQGFYRNISANVVITHNQDTDTTATV